MADFMGMMKQAAQLQSKMQEMQAELDTITVEGTAGGGMVTVTLTAKGDLKSVKLDRLSDEAVGKGNHRGPLGRGACRRAPQGRSCPSGKDESRHWRHAAATRFGAGVTPLWRAPLPALKSND